MTCVKIAARVALRLFPLTALHVSSEYPDAEVRVLACIKATIITSVSGHFRTSSIRRSADSYFETARGYISGGADGIAAAFAVPFLTAGNAFAASANTPLDVVIAISFGNMALLDFASSLDSDAFQNAAYIDAEWEPSFQRLSGKLWHETGMPNVLHGHWSTFVKLCTDRTEWSFWREWYQGFLDGTPLDWELQRRVALIPDADWEKGPEHIAGVIARIRQEFQGEPNAHYQPTNQERQNVAVRVLMNREALAISIAGTLEQIDAFREQVRGKNDLDPEYREGLLEFLNRLQKNLQELMHDLPAQNEEISEDKANRFVCWWRDFKPLATKKAQAYIAPQNVANATVPTGIILGCTGIGFMVAGPVGAGAGGYVGNLITGQIKPGRAVEELMKPSDPPPGEG